MYIRVTHYQMKPGSVEPAKELMNQMKDQIMAMPGMLRFTNSLNADGSGCVVAVVESQEISDGNKEAVAAAWSHFADHLAGPPEPHGFDVFVDWSN